MDPVSKSRDLLKKLGILSAMIVGVLLASYEPVPPATAAVKKLNDARETSKAIQLVLKAAAKTREERTKNLTERNKPVVDEHERALWEDNKELASLNLRLIEDLDDANKYLDELRVMATENPQYKNPNLDKYESDWKSLRNMYKQNVNRMMSQFE